MKNAKHYDFYKTSASVCQTTREKYQTTVAAKREALLNEMKEKSGCIAWYERPGFGRPDYISELIYPADHEIVNEPYIKIEKAMKIDDEQGNEIDVVLVRGMGNRNKGKEFNALIGYYNSQLKELSSFTDWIIQQFNVMRTGIGEPAERGFAMLSSFGGTSEDGSVLLFAIPNNDDPKHGTITIPDEFEKITYDDFYELTNTDGE